MTGNIRKSLAVVTMAGAAALGALVTAPAQAEAASLGTAAQTWSAQASSAQASSGLPNCVRVWQKSGWVTKRGYAYNGCRYNVRMKIIWAREMDGPCSTVAPGQTISSKRGRGPASFDGARAC
ncbi:hypothetical protein EDD27_10385 [Nonomuraea polychroma]|uniref:Alpha amylase inhibitor n=1 Tax=Nonomuraea polychroma TaxID=46176 RepID=A0A438MNU2_9ACTN|nr:hypothetical protein [Nonomuraea polychroma]RVX47450.1 hypothetical protein EDD27_10385 [Nonomuraea polychroma]